MNKKRIIFVIVFLIITSVIILSIILVQNKNKNSSKKEADYIQLGQDQKPDVLSNTNEDSVVIRNNDRLFNSLTSDQFQDFKAKLAYYVHKKIDPSISTVEVVGGDIKVVGVDVTCTIKVSKTNKNLTVKITPTSYYYTNTLINGEVAPGPPGEGED